MVLALGLIDVATLVARKSYDNSFHLSLLTAGLTLAIFVFHSHYTTLFCPETGCQLGFAPNE
jgi:hypothetical protein